MHRLIDIKPINNSLPHFSQAEQKSFGLSLGSQQKFSLPVESQTS